jgi:hypothetical protein
MTRRGVLLLALALAGCGGGGSSGDSQTASSTRQAAPLPPAPGLTREYRASLAYARCLRAHGLDHPDPDRNGDFSLTPKQEARLKASAPPKKRQQADEDCFHLLKGTVSTKPLSPAAVRAALAPLGDLKRCLAGLGYLVGKPMVKNLPRGRAMFGFDSAGPDPGTKSGRAKRHEAQLTCEKRVHLASRLDEIVKIDRGETR